MPVRKIPISGRCITGRLAGRGQPAVRYESGLERDFALLQLFDPLVERLEEQPVRIDYVAPGGKATHYTPDFLVCHKAGGRRDRLVEVKYREELERKREELAPRFAAARDYADGRGWVFEVATEVEIRTPRLENVKFLRPYRGRVIAEAVRSRLLAALRNADAISVQDLVKAAAGSGFSAQAEALAGLWTLVASGCVAIDLDQTLTMDTVLRTR